MRQLAPNPAQHRFLDLPGGRVAALDTARPSGIDPLGAALLVPGYTGSKEDFAPILGLLADCGFRVVAIDLPGQYESPGPENAAAYGVEPLARTVLEVMEALGEGPMHALGHSFGGLVVRAAAIAEPTRLRSVALLDSGPDRIVGPRRDQMDALEPVLAAGGMAAVYEANEALSADDPAMAAAPQALKDFLRRRFLASSPYGLQGMGDALREEPDRVAELRATGLPVLVAYGAYDDAWAPEQQGEMANRLGATQAVIDDALHSPALEQPVATANVLSRFWRRVESAD